MQYNKGENMENYGIPAEYLDEATIAATEDVNSQDSEGSKAADAGGAKPEEPQTKPEEPQAENKTSEVDEKDLETKINEIVEQLKEGKEPEDIDPTLLLAAKAEKRRRDTQAAYTKAQQEKIALQKEKEALENLVAQELEKSLDLSPEQKEELEELKLVDPEEWRRKLNELETEQKTLKKQKIEELKKEASEQAQEEYELERRMQVFEEFQKTHNDVEITDEVIENEVPPKYVKDLEAGKINFEEFLQKVYDFLTAGKVVEQPKAPAKPDLSKIPGGATPYEASPGEDLIELYRNTTL
jgi:hypothetical protein